jgi:hypothetical protein
VTSDRLDKAQVEGAPESQSETPGAPSERSNTVTLTWEYWQAWRRTAGLSVDPKTAEVTWAYAQVVDSYGVSPEIPPECDCIGRAYFARSPGMDVWVEFGDLPDATREALWEKHKSQLGFPAGLGFVDFSNEEKDDLPF